ncbi:DUF2635 domain-containing protein [Noviherbaspirillum cavernae]|uniref:DUF2635 domain-containing protein n=1 Tax=Noviherbaspirillum cavernae TaxID=2320862 RepID=A0A418X1C2_9BURK|nr:DUF2635 domain-containing protein [Noviherbaspirillum cavernae]RJG06249.1 DUF2635 domain-containing protein [Noviherbaspirillum cavernae]
MFVKPVPGRQVPDPDRGGYLSEDGRTVEASQYWLRRIVDGDVIEVQPKKGAKQ